MENKTTTATAKTTAKRKSKKDNNNKATTTRLLSEAAPDPGVLARIESFEADPDAGGMDIAAWAELLRLLLPGTVHGYDPSRPADRPTRHPPGSPGKKKVLARRARLGMAMHHQGDSLERRDGRHDDNDD